MPNEYKRKVGSKPRGLWTFENLKRAVNAVISKEMGVNEAAKRFEIPKTTLKRRLKKQDYEKNKRLGPDSSLGHNAEHKLVLHIKKLQKSGFAPTRDEVRCMAFKLAKQLEIPNKFNQEKGKNYKHVLFFLI